MIFHRTSENDKEVRESESGRVPGIIKDIVWFSFSKSDLAADNVRRICEVTRVVVIERRMSRSFAFASA